MGISFYNLSDRSIYFKLYQTIRDDDFLSLLERDHYITGGSMLSKLEKMQFNEIYKIMEESFPEEERRPYEEQRALLECKDYSIYVHIVKEEIVAFFGVWRLSGFDFIEHFAVKETHRNGGIGTKLLRELLILLKKPVILEVEPPTEKLTKSRIQFYERNGFALNDYDYFQPPISKGRSRIPLMIMTYPNQITVSQYENIRNALYQEVYHYYEK